MATFRKRPGPGGRTAWQAQIIRRGHESQYKTFGYQGRARPGRQLEGEMDRGVFVSRAEEEATILREALDRYKREVSSKKRSATRERSTIATWRASPLSDRALANIRGKDIAAAIQKKEGDGLGPNTIRIHLALLSHLFNTARTAWGMESLANPGDFVKGQRPKRPRGRNRRLVGDEGKRLLEAA